MDQRIMSAREASVRLSDYARGDLSPFLKFDEQGVATLDLSTPQAKEHLHLIKRIKVVDGQLDIELHDSKDAVIQMAKIHKLFGTADGVNVFVEKLSDDELIARLEERRRRLNTLLLDETTPV
jgi:hypothetical protein